VEEMDGKRKVQSVEEMDGKRKGVSGSSGGRNGWNEERSFRLGRMNKWMVRRLYEETHIGARISE
jgi:hypothetical protein